MQIKHLAHDVQRYFQIDLIKIEPNATLDKHLHPDVEWVYVLKGMLRDHRGEFVSGDFFVNEKGSVHQTSTGVEGCEILCCWCGIVEEL